MSIRDVWVLATPYANQPTMSTSSSRRTSIGGSEAPTHGAAQIRTRRGPLAGQSGMTVVEILISTSMAVIVMLGFFALIDQVSHTSANDQERSISLIEQTAALKRMTQELSETYEFRGPTNATSSNYVDVLAWLTIGGASQTARRIVYNCEVASSIAGERQCMRYEMPASDETAVASLSTDSSANKSIAIPRLLNGTESEPVFSLAAPREPEPERPTYGTATIRTPGQGERVRVTTSSIYTYALTLKDSFYMRNLDFGA